MHFDSDDIRANFDSGTYARGNDYARRGKVLSLVHDGAHIDGEVSGSGGQHYVQSILVRATRDGIGFKGNCDCPMGRNCKHVVAVLVRALDQAAAAPADRPAQRYLTNPMSVWLWQVRQAIDSAAAQSAKPSKSALRFMYVLLPNRSDGIVDVQLCKVRLDNTGHVVSSSKVTDLYNALNRPPPFVQAEDLYALRLYLAMVGTGSTYVGRAEARDAAGTAFIRVVLDAGALAWAASKEQLKAGHLVRLVSGPQRAGGLAWTERSEQPGLLSLGWQFSDDGMPIDFLLPTEPTMYVADGVLGELAMGERAPALPMRELQQLVARAPVMTLHDAVGMTRELTVLELNGHLPLPPAVQHVRRTDIAPRPHLLLTSRPGKPGAPAWDDHAVFGFDYDGMRVGIGSASEIARRTPQGSETIVRNAVLEERARQTLAALGMQAGPVAHSGTLRLAHANDWLAFTREALPRLRDDGWLIEQDSAFRFDLIDVDDWYADVDTGAEGSSDWFDLELGIVVNGARVALLPVLLQLIRSAPHEFNAAAMAMHGDDDVLITELPGEIRVGLPWGRVKPILSTLGELYFSDRVGTALRLPTLDAIRLAELEAAAQLRWSGGARLREIGQRLRDFGATAQIAAPLGLQASLRDYQRDGLAWMQFLRANNLGGILADDMGLGKTIQTLAHILLEKEAGRLLTPALVVAPTSLMGNWQAEAARFAPGLRVLLLHGADRQSRFGEIGQHDLVLTTYALLPRDEAQLRAQRFHLLILDESQYIKNSRSKAAQTSALLPAQHRLCLTGTPLQNHLGELWAQFHFLMPGLLGDEKTFNGTFRKPIEKLGDIDRNTFLVRRIRPFMLRRTKDAVAKELPAKTEMVREVELSGVQRDLYETVRLAMDKKVRDAIASKGVARSQIIILDALLKLRQVCCDPRLVKLPGQARQVAPSAKLDTLLEMVTDLLAEGRKILVFSQFTSMLALIEAELRERAISYALLTGDTRDRTEQVEAFQQGRVDVFLISLKAGGVGLNLTAADTVIHYDPWWNPAAENQATDRAWRIGQDKPVFVYKLIAKGTLEQKIQELQRKKSELADAVLAGGATPESLFTQDDLQAILAPL